VGKKKNLENYAGTGKHSTDKWLHNGLTCLAAEIHEHTTKIKKTNQPPGKHSDCAEKPDENCKFLHLKSQQIKPENKPNKRIPPGSWPISSFSSMPEKSCAKDCRTPTLIVTVKETHARDTSLGLRRGGEWKKRERPN
jgi:hypothetical protein